MRNVFKIKELRCMPRWLAFFIDISIISFSILISYLFLKSLRLNVNFIDHQGVKIITVISINLLFILLFLFKTYAGIIRYSTFFDFFKIVWSSGSTLIVLLGLNFMLELVLGKAVYLYPVLFLFFLVSIFLMFFFRMITKKFFNMFVDAKDALSKVKIAVAGIGDKSVLLANAIIHTSNHEKILIPRDPLSEFEDIEILSKEIIMVAMSKDSLQVVKILKAIVSEFINNNAEFKILDKRQEHKVYQ